ncbi:MAG TPA: hypothetical protein VKV02_10825 [Acidobacteriaceae bacterium]|nr:hypothetical protein [Acidobacteriaceae bacterium]
MDSVLRILKAAGGWHHGLHLRIENPPYMALVIEATDESGPCGLPALSLCHYGEQNGDAMRDPEMCFELEPDGELSPYYYRNDYVGVEQWSRYIQDGSHLTHRALFIQHVSFAKVWDRDILSQGYLRAFRPTEHIRG